MSYLASNTFGLKNIGSGGGGNITTDEIQLKTNSLKWITTPGHKPFKSVAYSPIHKLFVAVGHEEPYAAYSKDGINWIDCTGLTIPVDKIKFGTTSYTSGVFVAVGNTAPYAAYSEDGVNWSLSELPDLDPQYEGHYCGLMQYAIPSTGSDDSGFIIFTEEVKPTTAYDGYTAFMTTNGKTWKQIALDAYWSLKYRCGAYSYCQNRIAAYAVTGAQCYSYDGIIWRTYSMPADVVYEDTYNWFDAASAPTKIVIVGSEQSNNVGSYDQIAFNHINLYSLPNIPKSIAYGGDMYMIPVDSDKTYYSYDGDEWLTIGGLTNGIWNSCAYGNERWVIVGETPGSYAGYLDVPTLHFNSKEASISLSTKHQNINRMAPVDIGKLTTDNITTTNISTNRVTADYININDIISTAGRVQFGGTFYITSRDVNKNLPMYGWRSIAYGNGKFVALANGDTLEGRARVAYSYDGKNWELVDNIPNVSWLQIEFGNGRFVAVGGGLSMTSINAVTWDTYKTPTTLSILGYGNGMFIASYTSRTDKLYYSIDGAEWNPIELPKNDYIYPGAIAYGGGVWILGCDSSTATHAFYRSFDGFHWFGEQNNQWLNVKDLVWGPIGGTYGTWCCSDHAHLGAHYSIDGGATWQICNGASSTCWTRMCYGAGMFICIYGDDHSVGSLDFWYSYDGITWSKPWMQRNKTYWHDCCYGDGKFVLLGSNRVSNVDSSEYMTSGVVIPNMLYLGRNDFRVYLQQDPISNLGTLRSHSVDCYSANIRQINDVQEINGVDIGWLVKTVMELKKALEDKESLYGWYFGIDPNDWTKFDIPNYTKCTVYPYAGMIQLYNNDSWTYSSDLTSWTNLTTAHPLLARNGEYASGNYVYNMLLGYKNMKYYYSSSNGTSFTELNPPSEPEEGKIYAPPRMVKDMAYGPIEKRDGIFICVGSGFMHKSIDGRSFELVENMQDNNYTSICYGKNKYVATIAPPPSLNLGDLLGGGLGGTGDEPNREYEFPDIVINTATNGIVYSEDGVEWKEGNLQQRDWVKIIYYPYSRGLYVTLSSDGYIAWSYNADYWNEYKFSNEEGWSMMTSGNGLLYVAKSDKYMYTVELGVFKEGTKTFNNITDLTFGGGRFIICTADGVYHT